MPTRSACLLFLLSIAWPDVLIGRQNSDSEHGPQVKTDDFVLTLPDGWSQIKDNDTVATLLSPTSFLDGTFRENIRVKKYPLNSRDSLDSVLSAQLSNVEDNFEIIGSGILRNEAPRIAWLAISDRKAESGQPSLAKIDYMMINRGNLFVLHSMCETSNLDKHRKTFDAIAQSVQFTRASSTQQLAPPKQSGSQDNSAFESGRKIGRYTAYAMIAVIGVWLVIKLVKFVRK